MGLNGISTWQWAVVLAIFALAILGAPGLSRFRRAQLKGKLDARQEDEKADGE